MKTISVINRKGGVGKSTSSVNIGAILAAQCNAKVLIIDLDPQGTSSLYCGIYRDPEINLYHVLCGEVPIENAIINVENFCGIKLVSAGRDCDLLYDFLYRIKYEEHKDQKVVLKNVLKRVADKYDYCIIDCPPSKDVLTTNALVASDYTILPVIPVEDAMAAIPRMNLFVSDIKGKYNPKLINTGFVITRITERNKLQQEFDQAFRKNLNVKFYKNEIHESRVVANAIRKGRPLIKHSKIAKVTQDYIAVTNELLKYMKEK